MKKFPCWIVVADGSRARIFERRAVNGPLTEIESFENPIARLKPSDLLTDSAGQQKRSGTSVARGAIEASSLPDEVEEDRFANRLASQLGDAANRGSYSDLVIMAAPRFLGTLRSGLPPAARNRVVVEMAKNFTTAPAAEIQKHLDAAL